MKYRPLQLLAIVAVIALSAVGRFYHLAYHDLRGDEAFSILFAQEGWTTLLSHLRAGEPHPPLFFSTLKIWMEVAGQTEIATRWLSAAASVVMVPLAFKAGERLKGYSTGLAVAILVGANPSLIWNAQDVRMYAMGTAFCTGVAYWGLRSLDESRPSTRRDGLGLAAFALLAAYTHYVAAVVVGVVYAVLGARLLLTIKDGGRPLVRPWLTSAGIAAAAYAPWLLYAVSVLGPGYGGNMASPAPLDALRMAILGWTAGSLGAEGLSDAFLISSGVLLASAVLVTGRRHGWGVALVLAFLVVPSLALFAVSRSRPVFGERYLLFASPALYLLLGTGVTSSIAPLLRRPVPKFAWRTIAIAAAAVYFGATGLVLGNYFRDRGGEGPGTWRPFVAFFKEKAQAEDLVLVNHLDPSFTYYYRLLGVSAPAQVAPSRAGAAEPDLDEALQTMLLPGRHLWLAQDTARSWDPKGVAREWLDRHSVKIGAQTITGKPVLHYRVPDGEPVAAKYGDSLRLDRFELRTKDDALVVGSEVALDLVWRALKPLTVDYTISLQLIAADGTLLAQSDSYPRQGTVPTSAIRVTESLVDTREISLPRIPGIYRLALAVYDVRTMKRLAVAGTRDNLLVLANLAIVAH